MQPDINLALKKSSLITPFFVTSGNSREISLKLLPEARAFSVDKALKAAELLQTAGLSSIALFEYGAEKDSTGSMAFNASSAVTRTASLLRREFPGLFIISDLCFCQYTSHGECGVLNGTAVDNDESLKLAGRLAIQYCEAGVHALMPSGMLDGAAHYIRSLLNDRGYTDVSIFNQTAKFASSLFGPFRRAAQSHETQPCKSSYQIGIGCRAQAMKQIEIDQCSGADVALIKPAIFNLDIISSASESFELPLAAFCTSGEHALYFANGCDDEALRSFIFALERVMRAGAGSIFTYAAPYIARYLQ
ncbi:MAG: hypothetical protein J5J00_05285 [Deltaproteobacteria bacterium]|nr:hypothetical protein [Deltaproteobacteria bacterium]